jgi:putative endonuclease
MNYTVYILLSEKDGNLYVGCAQDVVERVGRHLRGHVLATKHRRPLVLIHTEEFSDKGEAFQRERFLKSLWGGREKKKIKEAYIQNTRNIR